MDHKLARKITKCIGIYIKNICVYVPCLTNFDITIIHHAWTINAIILDLKSNDIFNGIRWI